jgi:arylsulfatase A-like enzyme
VPPAPRHRYGGGTLCGLHRGIVELVDLYPTACDLLGMPRPAHLDGEALPLSPESPGKAAATSVCWNGRTVVTERYRFTRYHSDADLVIPCRGRRELFDLQADRRENRNVADDPRHAATVSELENLLRRRYGDLDSRRSHPHPHPRA